MRIVAIRFCLLMARSAYAEGLMWRRLDLAGWAFSAAVRWNERARALTVRKVQS